MTQNNKIIYNEINKKTGHVMLISVYHATDSGCYQQKTTTRVGSPYHKALNIMNADSIPVKHTRTNRLILSY